MPLFLLHRRTQPLLLDSQNYRVSELSIKKCQESGGFITFRKYILTWLSEVVSVSTASGGTTTMLFITIWAYIFVNDYTNGHVWDGHFPCSAVLLEIWVDFDLFTQLHTTYAWQLQNAVLVLRDVNDNTEIVVWDITKSTMCIHSYLL